MFNKVVQTRQINSSNSNKEANQGFLVMINYPNNLNIYVATNL